MQKPPEPQIEFKGTESTPIFSETPIETVSAMEVNQMQLQTSLPEPQIKFEDINSAKRKFATTELGENEMNEKRAILQEGQGQVKKNE